MERDVACVAARKFACVVLAGALALGFVPITPQQAFAEESETETLVALDVDASLLPDADVLAEGYINSVFYAEEDSGSQLSLLANYGESVLSGDDLEYYTQLKEFVQDVAANGGSTVWTYSDTFQSDTTDVSDDVVNFTEYLDYLLVDCPYDFYWYDKTASTTLLVGKRISYSSATGPYTITLSYTLSLPVASDYAGDEGYTVDETKAQSAATAAANAQAIVEEYADETNVKELLTAYKDEIQSLTTYNYTAAAGGVDYGDPWQLVYVFDGDEDTTVVCEGYAKAFQYLCDLTWPDNDPVTSYIVDGTLEGEGHMWNIVRVNSKSYLVDVTNAKNSLTNYLFLVGTSVASGSVSTGYTTAGYTYAYYDDTIDFYGEEILTLSDEEFPDTFEVEVPEAAEGLVYDGTELTGVATGTRYTVTGGTATDAGTYTATLSLIDKDSYVWASTGSSEDIEIGWSIAQADLSEATVTLATTLFTYDGAAKTPDVTVTLDGRSLSQGSDYTVTYADNTDVGVGTVSVVGIDNYTGTCAATFTIAQGTQELSFASSALSVHVSESTVTNALSGAVGAVSYASSDTGVATVADDGTVSVAGAGTATITATAAATTNYAAASASYTVTVSDHSYTSYASNGDATCDKDGTATATCDYDGCDATDTIADEGSALGHEWGAWTVTIAATCTVDGVQERVCAVCGETETAVVEASGHVIVEVGHDEDGHWGVCSVCGESVDYEEHAWGEWETVTEAACEEAGLEQRSCTSCGYTETSVTEALGHDYVAVVTDPTCEAAGYTTHACSRCGDVYVDGETEALGHDWGEWVVTVEPAVGVEGAQTRTCTVCGETETQVVDALEEGSGSTVLSFPDVQDSSKWYYDSVYQVAEAGLITGYDNGYFGVGDTMTRAQLAVVMWRIAEPEAAAAYDADDAVSTTTTVSGIADGKYYTAAADWAVAEGVINGKEASDGSRYFDPSGTVTFQEFCAVMANYLDPDGRDSMSSGLVLITLLAFVDADDVSEWAYASVAWCVDAGLMSGNQLSDGSLSIAPKTKIKRERAATVFANAINSGALLLE